MTKMRRVACPVCNKTVAVNWRSRELAYHLAGFPRLQKTLVAAISKFDLDSLGGNKYEKAGHEIMHHAVSLNRLLLSVERERRRAV